MYTCEHSCTALSEHVRSVSTIPANSCNLAQSEQVGASRHASRVGRSENAGAASRTQMRAELHSSGIQNNAGCTPVVRCAWRERTGRRIMALQANRPEREHTSRDRAYEQRCSRVARREAYEHGCSRVAQSRNASALPTQIQSQIHGASTHARSRAALHLPTPQASPTVTPIPPWQVPCSFTKCL